jgi:hypothetical protein
MTPFIARSFTVLLVTASLSGCVTVALGAAAMAGAGTAVYVKGQLKDTLDGTVAEVHRAARDTMEDVGAVVTVNLQDDYTGSLEGELSDGTRYWIDTERKSANTTKIAIRVGLSGDQSKSSDILERIKSRLYGLQ